MSDDFRAFQQGWIPPYMVTVVVGVEDISYRLVRNGLDLLKDFGDVLFELVVDQYHPLFSHEHADVAAAAQDHVSGRANLFGFEARVGLLSQPHPKASGSYEDRHSSHNRVLIHRSLRDGLGRRKCQFAQYRSLSGHGCSNCSLGFRAGRKGCRDTEDPKSRSPERDMSRPYMAGGAMRGKVRWSMTA